jgi:hypothetical protein
MEGVTGSIPVSSTRNKNGEDMIMAAKDWQANETAETLSRNFSEFLSSRRSTRDFLTNPIPSELLEQLIADSLTAPSWSNTRPFKVCVATGDVQKRISSEFIGRW